MLLVLVLYILEYGVEILESLVPILDVILSIIKRWVHQDVPLPHIHESAVDSGTATGTLLLNLYHGLFNVELNLVVILDVFL